MRFILQNVEKFNNKLKEFIVWFLQNMKELWRSVVGLKTWNNFFIKLFYCILFKGEVRTLKSCEVVVRSWTYTLIPQPFLLHEHVIDEVKEWWIITLDLLPIDPLNQVNPFFQKILSHIDERIILYFCIISTDLIQTWNHLDHISQTEL